MPRTASGVRNSGTNTIRATSSGTSPACRGMPNFAGKSVRACATGRISVMGGILPSQPGAATRKRPTAGAGVNIA